MILNFKNILSYFIIFIFLSAYFASSSTAVADDVNLRKEIYYGIASWYGGRFHGRQTSNGEKYDKRDLTAAHKELPFNTIVKVTNVKNNKSVVVRINDRGPFRGNRIIDLSQRAAEIIDTKEQGIAYVKLQVLESPNLTEIAKDNSFDKNKS